uniref:FYVE and coiled-coil domain-containing protein 1-like n=1 Tax=Gadus morhua TaxID=8049 RepID=A0A8C5CMM0_GADMO
MASTSVGENQLQRIIRDLRDAVLELIKEHNECGEPITDDSSNLHKFSYKLEYLLQFDQKEKTTFLGQRKDYWDYFSDCLSKIKGVNDGIRFVKSIPELKTSLGKGRAFIRYSLVHQRLADTLQQCLINHKVTSEWYYARSPFLKSHLTADIINHLYELNQVLFDVASRGHDLDADWPTFARRTLGVNSPAYLWKPPSRCSSINSLASNYSHSQVVEFPPNLEMGHSLLGDLGELGEPSSSAADALRLELNRSELRQQALLAQVQASDREAVELRALVENLRGQLAERRRGSERAPSSEPNATPEESTQENASYLQLTSNAGNSALQERLSTAENKNVELLGKLDGALSEKGQQTASYCDSALKIQELIDQLKAAEEERLAARREADDWAKRAQQVIHKLKLREEETRRSSEEKLAKVKAAARGEQEQVLKRLEDLQGVVGRIEGALTLKEKEAGNLRSQLQDLQASLEHRERQAEELKKRLREERRDVTWRSSNSQNEFLDSQLLDLREKLKDREQELAHSSERVKYLEAVVEKLDVEKKHLNAGNDVFPIDQSKILEDYKSQCASLMEINAKLLQTVKRSEASNRELSESRAAMRDQLASLTASQNPLKVQEEAAMLSIEERETKLLEANQRLEEVVHKALLQSEASDATLKRLERDNKEIMETQLSLKKQLASTQGYLDAIATKETQLGGQPLPCDFPQSRAEVTRSDGRKTDGEKSTAEKPEKAQKLHNAHHHASHPDAGKRHLLAEAQLELNLREVTTLQDEVVELRAQLLAGAAERMKVQALQEVTEASREDLRMLVEQLKAQVEELNRRHVDEILHSREREDTLGRQRDGEARVRDDLAAEAAASREELRGLKLRYEAACLESAEAAEALHRANTETAELGVHVCTLSAEKEEARLRWEALSAKLRELEEEASRETQRLSARMEQLSRENRRLSERLGEEQGTGGRSGPPEEEEEAPQETETQQESCQTMSQADLPQGVNEELQELRSKLGVEREKAVLLESEVKQLEAENRRYSEQIEGKSAQMSQSQLLVQQRDEELNQMKGKLLRTAEGLAMAEKSCEEMSDRLRRANQEQQSRDVKMAAELDDLYRTKINLEERLIELIRDKDELWQKSDALEFEQKLREEETERDVNHCLDCHSQFSWWLRKYTCRLCGRPFCYYCCSNTVSTLQAGGGGGGGGAAGNRERCCRHCYDQHSAVVERHPQEQDANAPDAPFGALPQPGDRAAAGGDDGVFDIITEEEVSGVYDSDSLSFSTACSPGHGQEGAAQLEPQQQQILSVLRASVGPNSRSGAGAEDPPPAAAVVVEPLTEEPEEAMAPAVQDAEICLLKAGELTLSAPYTLEDIEGFGDASRELFVRSSCYSVVPITVGPVGPQDGPTVTWVFTSEPKSISFSVVYREDPLTPPEDAKVLIPLTRCNSHKETIQGELKVRLPGEYTLVFDNSFSRFISKKVLYRLSVAKPVVYDGSDCP